MIENNTRVNNLGNHTISYDISNKNINNKIEIQDNKQNTNHTKKIEIQQNIQNSWEKAAGKEKEEKDDNSISTYIEDEIKFNFTEYSLSKTDKASQKLTSAKETLKRIKAKGVKETLEEIKNNSKSIKDTASKIKEKIKNARIENPFKDGVKEGLKNIGKETIQEIKESGEAETLRLAREGIKKAASKESIKSAKNIVQKGIQAIETQGAKQVAKQTVSAGLRGISKAAGPIVAIASAGYDLKTRLDEGKNVGRAVAETVISTGASVLGAAAAGAALGAVAGPVGAAAGAIIGGALAAFGADKLMEKFWK